jgi:hypothetical protein
MLTKPEAFVDHLFGQFRYSLIAESDRLHCSGGHRIGLPASNDVALRPRVKA